VRRRTCEILVHALEPFEHSGQLAGSPMRLQLNPWQAPARWLKWLLDHWKGLVYYPLIIAFGIGV
jgi:hypothetical protein